MPNDPVILSPAKRALLARLRGGGAGDMASIPRQPGNGPFPLSYAQERVYFVGLLAPEFRLFNLVAAARLPFRVPPEGMERRAAELATRHDTLRTSIQLEEGEPRLLIAPSVPVTVPVIDLSDADPADTAALAEQTALGIGLEPYSLSRAPLWRLRLVLLPGEQTLVVMAAHHIVLDGTSLGLLIDELGDFGTRPVPTTRFADFASWQRDQVESGAYQAELGYWRQRVAAPVPRLELPADRPPAAEPTYAGATISAPLPAGTAARIVRLSRAENATPYITLLAAFYVALYRWTGERDILIGATVAGRTHPDVQLQLGMFINTVLLRTQVTGRMPFRQVLARVRATCSEGFARQHIPYERLARELGRGPHQPPLATVSFNMPLASSAVTGRPGDAMELPMSAEGSQFDLTMHIFPAADGGFRVFCEYSADLFDRSTAAALLDQYLVLIDELLADPERPVGLVPLLRPAARAALVAVPGGGRGAGPSDQGGLYQRVAAVAAATPGAAAVISGPQTLTYDGLMRRAAAIAALLRRRGARRGDPVAVRLPRGPDLACAVLAVWAIGGVYVPVGPELPPARAELILTDAGATIVLDESTLADAGTAGGALADAALADAVTPRPDEAAYCIYTSGSTGRPKGVLVTQAGIANRVLWAVREHGFGPADRMLHKTRSSFDAHVWEILAPLVSGGTVVMAPPGVEEDPRAMLAAVAADKVTVLQVVPSVLRLLADLSAAEDWAAADSLRLLFCGGEPLQAALCRKVAGLRPGLRIVNTYGPTECAIDVTAHVVDAGQGPAGQSPAGQSPADGEPPAAGALVPIGTPITGTRALVLDDEGELLPPGVPGELCVTGPGVGLGYHRRPGQTAAAFVPDPYGPPGGRMYHTGDRVRRRPDGTLEFIGRRDHQVKVNGVRVELGEIESVLAAHPQVTAAVVTAAASADGTRLTGYVTGPADPGELRGYLRGRLPAPMVPAAFVVLREFPLSPSGKVDRAALPAAGGAAAGRREYAPPRTHAEQVITGIWAELLAVEPQRVGRDDDFFELGGHSLLTVRLAARLRGAFDVDLALRDLLTATTVAGQADLLGRQQTVQPVVPVPRDGPLPLSSGQRRLWFLDRLDPGGTQYVLPHVMRLHGAVDRAALRQALTEVVTRHEILRTRYVSADGEPGQVADPPGELPLSTATATGEELEGVLGELVGRPFDLAAGPVLRATLVTMADADEHLLVLCVHHIACDGWSMEIIGRELLACYAAARAGRPAGLHEPVLQYADYASWQQDRLTSPELSGDLAYWRGRLAGAVGAEVPPDRPRPPVWSGRGAMSSFTVPAELAGQLGRLGRGAGATPFMTMLAAFVVLLSRYTGSQDIVVGTPVAGRVDAQTRGLVGFFVNTLVLRTDLSGAPSFTELLRRVRTDCLAAYAHQDVPFERLVEDMQPDRDPSRNPVFQIMFEMGTDTVTAEAGGLSAEPVWDGLGWRTAKFDLTLGVAERTDGSLYGYIEYATDLFDAGTIDRLAANYLALLRSAVRAPGLAIGGLELLSGAERRMLLRDLSAEVGSGPPESAERLDEAIARQAAATPDAIAVEQGGITLSYARLEAAASAFAQALRGRGVAAETPVAVCARRGIGVVIALLAILKAGGVYLPLDPDNPPDRIASLLADSGAAIVLSEADLPDPRDRPGEPQAAPEPVTGPDNLAYVIYTSGSTGAPKGVMISHRAYLHHCRVIGDAYDIRPGDRVTLLSALVFDVAMDQMAATLLAGATIVVAESGLTSPARLAGWLGAQRVTHVEITPAHYRELMATVAPGDGRLGRLRLMNVGSDVVTYDDARRWYATGLPGTFLCNYGPTECTVTCTLHPVSAQEADDHRREQTVPIGRPVAGTRAYVLDRWLNPVPPGVPGELYLGGVRLARGYLRRPGLTAQRFIPDPFGPPGERLYRTGDLVRYREDGAIEFLGRLDTQVKIRGFRIELGEIEATLAGHPLVRAAAVTAHRAGGAPELSAYAVIEDGAEPRELRDYLRTRLPSYMVPAYWTILPELPLTPSGKVDRRALPAPERLRRAYAAPATPAQQQIAGVWARVLNLERVGIHDDFFEVGGHSLLATRVHTRIEELFAIELPLRRLFDATTVAALAAVVEAEVEARIAMLSDDEVEALLAQTAGPAGPAQTAQERTGDTARQNLTSEQRGESE